MSSGPPVRLARAMQLLRLDVQSSVESLAEALWLARLLPNSKDAEQPNDTPRAEPRPAPSVPEKSTEASQSETHRPLTTRETFGAGDAARAGLFTPSHGTEAEQGTLATRVAVPTGENLPRRKELERALKPFLRRWPSRRVFELDLSATAEVSADRKQVTPVFRSSQERWFDIALLVENSDAMRVWESTVRELEALLARHGAFRQVRMWRFAVRDGVLRLSTASGLFVARRALADPEGRRLSIFLTNGTSPEWKRPPLVDFVAELGQRGVTAIFQMLPPRAWAHTSLGDALDQVHNRDRGTTNRRLRLYDTFRGSVSEAPDARSVPMSTLEPDEIAKWARFVMSARSANHRAVRLDAIVSSPAPSIVDAHADDRTSPTPAERLRAFRSIASPEAFQLLRLLSRSPAPMTVPMMRLVQRTTEGDRSLVHLAEVILSGVLERFTPIDDSIPSDDVVYDFAPGTHELLDETLSSGERLQVDALADLARERIRRFVEEHTGHSIYDFQALLIDAEGVERLPKSARAFVEVTRRIYERRGVLAARAAPLVDLKADERSFPNGEASAQRDFTHVDPQSELDSHVQTVLQPASFTSARRIAAFEPADEPRHGLVKRAATAVKLAAEVRDWAFRINRMNILQFTKERFPECYEQLEGDDLRLMRSFLEVESISNSVSLLGRGLFERDSDSKLVLQEDFLKDAFGLDAAHDDSMVEDYPEPNTGRQRWFFVNGIVTSREMARSNVDRLRALFSKTFTIVHIPTQGLVHDLVESTLQKFTNLNTEPVARAFIAIVDCILDPTVGKIVVIAHSQGTIVMGDVLDLVYCCIDYQNFDRTNMNLQEFEEFMYTSHGTVESRDLHMRWEALKGKRAAVCDKLELYMFANAASRMCYLDDENPLPHIESFANEHDIVTRLGSLAQDEFHEEDIVRIDGPLYMSHLYGHLLNAHYLSVFEKGEYALLEVASDTCVRRSIHDTVGGNPSGKNARARRTSAASQLVSYMVAARRSKG
jgi:hypothetical protein